MRHRTVSQTRSPSHGRRVAPARLVSCGSFGLCGLSAAAPLTECCRRGRWGTWSPARPGPAHCDGCPGNLQPGPGHRDGCRGPGQLEWHGVGLAAPGRARVTGAADDQPPDDVAEAVRSPGGPGRWPDAAYHLQCRTLKVPEPESQSLACLGFWVQVLLVTSGRPPGAGSSAAGELGPGTRWGQTYKRHTVTVTRKSAESTNSDHWHHLGLPLPLAGRNGWSA